MFEILRETYKSILISCGHVLLFTNEQLSCIQVRDGVVLGQSITGVLLYYAKVSPFIMYCEVCCCLHVKQIVYKHFNT